MGRNVPVPVWGAQLIIAAHQSGSSKRRIAKNVKVGESTVKTILVPQSTPHDAAAGHARHLPLPPSKPPPQAHDAARRGSVAALASLLLRIFGLSLTSHVHTTHAV
mmetsp:Transcript_24894/g.50533  ORF Transcript_24894/g.50533 Transcript_24894/m.50533 type:complete len:106 (-) Transcript_24894:64-381(-)